jgi:hypothetical protein
MQVIEVDFKLREVKNITYQSKEVSEANEEINNISDNDDTIDEEVQISYDYSTVQEVTQCYHTMLEVVKLTIKIMQDIGYDKPNAQQIAVRMMEDCIDELWETGVL